MDPLLIAADWDDEAQVWVATSEDIIGLATEAETLEALHSKLADIVPELIAENGLPDGKDAHDHIEIVARQRLAIQAA